MKILLIDVNCKYSSTGKIVYDLYHRLNDDGYDAHVAYGRGDLIDEPKIYKFSNDFETKKHALLARITGKNGYYSPKSTSNLIKYIEEFSPDVIHIHELHAYFVNHIRLLQYLKEKQIPIIWTFHCEYMYTGKCGFAYECERYKDGCGKCPHIRNYVSSFGIDKTAMMLADKKQAMTGLNIISIVTPSRWLADRVMETYLKDYRVDVIHNGIDTDSIFFPRKGCESLRESCGLKETDNIVLSVAPNIMDSRKGGQTVIALATTMPDTQFVLVGADETKRISNNVQLISRTKDQDELARWYSVADVFLICSRAENFPTTCIEALCCGTPIVGIDKCGTKETAPLPFGIFVKDDANVLESLRAAVQSQLKKDFSKEEIRGYALNHYDNRVMYNRYCNLFNMAPSIDKNDRC